jgi:hypothetical protein
MRASPRSVLVAAALVASTAFPQSTEPEASTPTPVAEPAEAVGFADGRGLTTGLDLGVEGLLVGGLAPYSASLTLGGGGQVSLRVRFASFFSFGLLAGVTNVGPVVSSMASGTVAPLLVVMVGGSVRLWKNLYFTPQLGLGPGVFLMDSGGCGGGTSTTRTLPVGRADLAVTVHTDGGLYVQGGVTGLGAFDSTGRFGLGLTLGLGWSF